MLCVNDHMSGIEICFLMGFCPLLHRVASQFVKKHGFDAVRVLRVSSNRGKGHAVKRGVACTRGETILFMDADGATRVSDLEKLDAELLKVQKQTAVSAIVLECVKMCDKNNSWEGHFMRGKTGKSCKALYRLTFVL